MIIEVIPFLQRATINIQILIRIFKIFRLYNIEEFHQKESKLQQFLERLAEITKNCMASLDLIFLRKTKTKIQFCRRLRETTLKL